MSAYFHPRHGLHVPHGAIVSAGSAADDLQAGTERADALFGGAGDDIQFGGGGNDLLDGGRGDDIQFGGRGADILLGGRGNDVQLGEAGDDVLFGGAGNDIQFGGSGRDVLDGGRGDDLQFGGSGGDLLRGGRGDDIQFGESGNDWMDGGRGNDLLIGGLGADVLTGGKGRDVFAYLDVADSLNAPGQYDIITDFKHGMDKIDLSMIDASIGAAGKQAFHYVAFDPTRALEAGQITSHYDAALGRTIVEGNIDALGDAELRIELNGRVSLDQSDFLV